MGHPDSIDWQHCTLGLDIGGTKMAGCVLTSTGEVAATCLSETRAGRGTEAVVANALTLVQSLINQATQLKLQPVGLGISVCELVDRDGSIVSDFTLSWREPTVLEPFRSLLPIVVEADCRAGALAEARFGVAKEFPSFLYVTIGTGISCSLVIDGVPYQGARGCTGTMATGTLSTLCSECGEISHSNLEQMASGLGIENRYAKLSAVQHPKSQRLSSREILQLAEEEEAVARRVIEQAGECVGSAVSLLVNVLDPHAVVVGGGLGSANGLYWDTLVRTMRGQIWSEIHRDLPIVQGTLGVNAGAIGAAAKVQQIVDGKVR